MKSQKMFDAMTHIDEELIERSLTERPLSDEDRAKEKSSLKERLYGRLKALSIPKRIAFAALALIILAGLGITGIAAAGGLYVSPEPSVGPIDPETGLKKYLTKEEVMAIFEEALEMYKNRDPEYDSLYYEDLGFLGLSGTIDFDFVDVSGIDLSSQTAFNDQPYKDLYYPVASMVCSLISERTEIAAWSTLLLSSPNELGSLFFGIYNPFNRFYISCSENLSVYENMDQFCEAVSGGICKRFHEDHTIDLDLGPDLKLPEKFIEINIGKDAVPYCVYYDSSDPDNPKKELIFASAYYSTGSKDYLTKEDVAAIFEEAKTMYENRDPAFETLSRDGLGGDCKGVMTFEYVDMNDLVYRKVRSLNELENKYAHVEEINELKMYYVRNYYGPIAIMASKLIKERVNNKAWSTLFKTSYSKIASISSFPLENEFYLVCSDDLGGYTSMDKYSESVGLDLVLIHDERVQKKENADPGISVPAPPKMVVFEVGYDTMPLCCYVDSTDPDNVVTENLFPDKKLFELIEYSSVITEEFRAIMNSALENPTLDNVNDRYPPEYVYFNVSDPSTLVPDELYTTIPQKYTKVFQTNFDEFMSGAVSFLYCHYCGSEGFSWLFDSLGIETNLNKTEDEVLSDIDAGIFEMMRRCCDGRMFCVFSLEGERSDKAVLNDGARILLADLDNGFFDSAEEFMKFCFDPDGSKSDAYGNVSYRREEEFNYDKVLAYLLNDGKLTKLIVTVEWSLDPNGERSVSGLWYEFDEVGCCAPSTKTIDILLRRN